MNINRLKCLSISFFFMIIPLLPEVQCMEEDVTQLDEQYTKIEKKFERNRDPAMSSSLVFQVNLNCNKFQSQCKSGRVNYGWVVYLISNHESYNSGFCNYSKNQNTFRIIYIDLIKKLEAECKEKSGIFIPFKISLGNSTNNTFNISMHFRPKESEELEFRKLGNLSICYKYNKEAVIDIHFNYPNNINKKLDQDIVSKYIDDCTTLISKKLILPKLPINNFSNDIKEYGIAK